MSKIHSQEVRYNHQNLRKQVLNVGIAEDLYAKNLKQEQDKLASDEIKLAKYYNDEVNVIMILRSQILARSKFQASKTETALVMLEGISYVSWPIFHYCNSEDDPYIYVSLLSDGRFIEINTRRSQDISIYNLKKVEKCSKYSVGGGSHITHFRKGMINLAKNGFGIFIHSVWENLPESPNLDEDQKSFFKKLFG